MTSFSDLIDGYRRFRQNGWTSQRERWNSLAASQSPKVMVIACCDSRVDPATIFDASPGEMFVVRNIANLVPPFEATPGRHGVSAALEFAVTQLEVEEIIVMGHGQCGGIAAAMNRRFEDAAPGEGGFIASWIHMLDDARDRVTHEHGPDATHELELEAIKTSLVNLRSFACIRERIADGRLSLRGAWFSIDAGKLHVLDTATGEFKPA
jgi:carbonic anhydrase